MASTVLPIAALGGLAGLDVVSFPQAMISRPIVGATAAGALCGDALAGLLAGAALEMLAMETLPVGASRYPEWGSASVVGGAVAAGMPVASAGSLALGAIAGLATAWIGGWSMFLLRRLNGRWSAKARARLEGGDASVVTTLQLRGLAVDYLRGALLTAGVLLLARAVVPLVVERVAASNWWLVFLLAALAASVAASALWRHSPAVKQVRWYAAIALGVALAVAVAR